MLPGMTAGPAQGGTVVAGKPSCVSSLLTDPPSPPPVVLGDFAWDGSFASAVGGANSGDRSSKKQTAQGAS